jgi:hypothetical protein
MFMRVNVFLPTPERHTGGSDAQLHSFLNSPLGLGDWSISSLGALLLGKIPGIGGWVGLKIHMDVLK